MHNPDAFVRAIAAHIDGWRSATFAWQDDPDPVQAERNKQDAIQRHAAECLRRIQAELVASGVAPTRVGEHNGGDYDMRHKTPAGVLGTHESKEKNHG